MSCLIVLLTLRVRFPKGEPLDVSYLAFPCIMRHGVKSKVNASPLKPSSLKPRLKMRLGSTDHLLVYRIHFSGIGKELYHRVT